MRRSALLFSLCALLSLLILAGLLSRPRHTERPHRALGLRLPDSLFVTHATGARVTLRELLRGRPAVLYIFSPEHCASCSNLPMEFHIVRQALPWVVPLLVGSGSPRHAFDNSLTQMQLADQFVSDQGRQLLSALGLTREPLVVVLDSNRRVVFVDGRSVPEASRYPMGRVLGDLRAVLHDPHAR